MSSYECVVDFYRLCNKGKIDPIKSASQMAHLVIKNASSPHTSFGGRSVSMANRN